MQEWEDLLNKLEVQSREAQHCRAASELLGRCLMGWAGRAVPAWGGGSCPRPSMWEGEGHVSQTETALARPPAPPLPPPAVSPFPHLLPPKSTQDSPSCPLHWHPKLSTLSPEQAVLSHLLPGSQDSSWGLLHLSKMVHKTPFISLPVHWGGPRALLVSCGSGGCGAVDIGALWTLLCLSYHPGVGESGGGGTRTPSRLTLLTKRLCGDSHPTHCCSRTDAGQTWEPDEAGCELGLRRASCRSRGGSRPPCVPLGVGTQ